MTHYDIELVFNEGSRDLSVGFTTGNEQLVIAFCLDDTIEPINQKADFYNYDKEIVALEFAYNVFPVSRWIPTRDMFSLIGDSNVQNKQEILLVLTDISLTERADNYWVATGTYSANLNTGLGIAELQPDAISLPYVQMNFTIGGGTRKIFKNLNFTAGGLPVLATGSTSPDTPEALSKFGAIGLTEDTLAGTNIPTFDLRIQITGYYAPESVDFDFVNELKAVSCGPNYYGTYNDKGFMGQSAGEVSIIGISGGTRVGDVIPLTFEFSVIANQASRSDLGFPTLTVVLGQDLLEYGWFRKNDNNVKKLISTPDFRAIHRVKDEIDYDQEGRL